jgi:hypothetical protein
MAAESIASTSLSSQMAAAEEEFRGDDSDTGGRLTIVHANTMPVGGAMRATR